MPSLYRKTSAYQARTRKLTLRITAADLTATQSSQAFELDGDVPAGAHVLSANVSLAEAFAGGGASAVTVDLGTEGDPDSIITAADVFASAVDGQPSSAPRGIAPNRPAVGLRVTVASDIDVVDLTAGDVAISVVCALPEAS